MMIHNGRTEREEGGSGNWKVETRAADGPTRRGTDRDAQMLCYSSCPRKEKRRTRTLVDGNTT